MMNISKTDLWQRFQKYYTEYPSLGLALDLDNFERAMFRLKLAWQLN